MPVMRGTPIHVAAADCSAKDHKPAPLQDIQCKLDKVDLSPCVVHSGLPVPDRVLPGAVYLAPRLVNI